MRFNDFILSVFALSVLLQHQTKTNNIMTTIATKGNFKVLYNDAKTYFVIDNTGQVWYRVTSERIAINKLNKIA